MFKIIVLTSVLFTISKGNAQIHNGAPLGYHVWSPSGLEAVPNEQTPTGVVQRKPCSRRSSNANEWIQTYSSSITKPILPGHVLQSQSLKNSEFDDVPQQVPEQVTLKSTTTTTTTTEPPAISVERDKVKEDCEEVSSAEELEDNKDSELEYNVSYGHQDSSESQPEDNVGSGALEHFGSRSQHNNDPGSQKDVGFGPQHNVGSVPQNNVGSGPLKGVDSWSEPQGNVGPRFQHNVGSNPQNDRSELQNVGSLVEPRDNIGFKSQYNVGIEPQDNVRPGPQKDFVTGPQEEVGFLSGPYSIVGYRSQHNIYLEPQENVGSEPQEDLISGPQHNVGLEPEDKVGSVSQVHINSKPKEDVAFNSLKSIQNSLVNDAPKSKLLHEVETEPQIAESSTLVKKCIQLIQGSNTNDPLHLGNTRRFLSTTETEQVLDENQHKEQNQQIRNGENSKKQTVGGELNNQIKLNAENVNDQKNKNMLSESNNHKYRNVGNKLNNLRHLNKLSVVSQGLNPTLTPQEEDRSENLQPAKGMSNVNDSPVSLINYNRVCYACSTADDASCWAPDRRTTVKYCYRGHDACVTKQFKSGKLDILIRDCARTCDDSSVPGIEPKYTSCAICHKDLCNVNVNSAFRATNSLLLVLFTAFIIKYNY